MATVNKQEKLALLALDLACFAMSEKGLKPNEAAEFVSFSLQHLGLVNSQDEANSLLKELEKLELDLKASLEGRQNG